MQAVSHRTSIHTPCLNTFTVMMSPLCNQLVAPTCDQIKKHFHADADNTRVCNLCKTQIDITAISETEGQTRQRTNTPTNEEVWRSADIILLGEGGQLLHALPANEPPITVGHEAGWAPRAGLQTVQKGWKALGVAYLNTFPHEHTNILFVLCVEFKLAVLVCDRPKTALTPGTTGSSQGSAPRLERKTV
jgi:hypothetical protein